MTDSAKRLLEAASTLPEDERLELASGLIASVDGPPDGDWESAWVAELDGRAEAARDMGGPAPEWSEVRARVLSQLGATARSTADPSAELRPAGAPNAQ